MSETPKSIVVIGAGIAGVASALFLQRDGHTVTILDPRGVGEGVLFGNAGTIAPDILCADGASGHNETGPEDAARPRWVVQYPLVLPAEISPLADRLNPQ